MASSSRPGRALWCIRGFAVLGVAAAFWLLTPAQVVLLFIVAGQGHFAASYYYQYKRDLLTPRYALAYAVSAVGLFAGFALYRNADAVIALSSLCFAVHLLQDEAHLLGRPATSWTGLEIAPALSLYAGLIVERSLSVPCWPFCFAAALCALCALGWGWATRRTRCDAVTLYFLGLAALAGAAYWLPLRLSFAAHVMGAAILYHYANWYGHYYVRYRGDARRRRVYLAEIGLVNLAVLALFALYSWGVTPLRGLGASLFSPTPFYLWTILHITFVTRRADWGLWIPVGRVRGEFNSVG